MLLGCVLEELRQQAWELLIHADLFAPLGMLSAGFDPAEIGAYRTVQPPLQPWPHVLTAGGVWQPVGTGGPTAVDNPEAYGPAGTVHANLIDWARLTACHLQEGQGETNTTATLAQFLLHPATFHTVHVPYVFPSTGKAPSPYSLSAYSSSADILPVGWGDVRLNHDGSNTQWYSRSSLFLHGSRPFAVLAAFNAAPSNASTAMTWLMRGVTGRWARWLEEQRAAAAALVVNATSCAPLANMTLPNAPLSTSNSSTFQLNVLFFTPLTLAVPSSISSISVFPAAGNSGLSNVTLALYSSNGVLLGQTPPLSVNTSLYSGGLQRLTGFFSEPLLLINDSYYAALWCGGRPSTQLLLYSCPSCVAFYASPPAGVSYDGVVGDMSRVEAEALMYGAATGAAAPPLVELAGDELDCPAALSSFTASSSSSSSTADSRAATASASWIGSFAPVVGGVAALLLVLMGGFFLYSRRRRRTEDAKRKPLMAEGTLSESA